MGLKGYSTFFMRLHQIIGVSSSNGRGRVNDIERERLIRLLNDPPPGSKLAAAKEYGIDLTLLIHNLELTPAERVRELAAAQPSLEKLWRADKRRHS